MNIHILAIVVLALVVGACDRRETEAGAPKEEVSGQPAAPTAEPRTGMGADAFIRHMHEHASRVANIYDALAAGDLEAAKRPAYWLLKHDEVTDLPGDWLPYVENMRDAARAVADAGDIASVRVAAGRIEASCNGCHAASGFEVDLSMLNTD